MKRNIAITHDHSCLINRSPPNSSFSQRLFDKLAYRLQGIVKFFSVDKSAVDVFTAIGAKPSDSPLVLIVTKNGDLDDSANRFTGEWTEGELRNFIVNNKLPLVNELDQHNFDDVTTSGKKIVYAIVNTKQPQQSAEFDKILYKLAKQSTFRDAFVFARLDGIKYHKYISQFGVVVGEGGSDVSSLPTMVVLDPALDYYYAPNGHGPNANIVHPIGGEREIQQFLTDILDGRIPLTGTTPWYNPTRYVRLLEKSLSKWPVWQVAVLAVAVMTAIVGSLFWCCFYGMDGEDFTIEAQQAAAAAIATTKKAKKKETLQSTNNFENAEADKEEDGIRQRKGKD